MKTKIIIISFLLLCSLYSCKKAEVTNADQESVNSPFINNAQFTGNLVVAYNIVVAKDGTGNYTTVQAAVNAVPNNSSSRTVIYIKNGTYKETVVVAATKKNVTMIGQSVSGVKLTYDNYSSMIDPVTGLPYTSVTGSASTKILADGFYAVNITFENNSYTHGQALAIAVTADKAVFNNCNFLGRQDTYYGSNGREYLRSCYLEGTTDFIYGAFTGVFESCKIYSYGGTAMTAASTESYVTYGLVFLKCNITGATGVHTDLGRPWRPYASVAFLNTSMTSIINPAGWDDWGNAANQTTARYSEYRNNGTGSGTSARVPWSHQLTSAQAANYTVANILKTTYTNPVTTDNWDPTAVISTTGAPIN